MPWRNPPEQDHSREGAQRAKDKKFCVSQATPCPENVIVNPIRDFDTLDKEAAACIGQTSRQGNQTGKKRELCGSKILVGRF